MIPREAGGFDFTGMDSFMDHITETIKSDGAIAVNVFPANSYVVLSYADRVAQEVVSRYILPLASLLKRP